MLLIQYHQLLILVDFHYKSKQNTDQLSTDLYNACIKLFNTHTSTFLICSVSSVPNPRLHNIPEGKSSTA